jgi:hypothetical protein
MELPIDILNIIHQYSKPCLRYPKPYKKVLQLYGLKRWPELGKKLSGNDASKFITHVDIFISRMNAYRTGNMGWIEDWDIRKNLLIAVYGEIPDFRWWWNYDDDEDDDEE